MTIVLTGILFAASSIILRQGLSSYENVQTRGSTLQDARYAMERIAKELIKEDDTGPGALQGIAATQVTFVDSSSITTNFRLVGTNLMRGNDTLLNNVTSLAFTGYDQNNVATLVAANVRRIHIVMGVTPKAGQATPVTFQTDVFLRNFVYDNFQ